MSFFEELKRRNVIRVAGLYIVGSWLIVQVATTILPMFESLTPYNIAYVYSWCGEKDLAFKFDVS